MKQISSAFRMYASKVIANPNLELSDDAFDRYLSKLAFEYSFKVPSLTNNDQRDIRFRAVLGRLSGELQYKVIEDFCNLPNISSDAEVKNLLDALHNKYSCFLSDTPFKSELIETTKHWLDNYPLAKKQYDNALAKLEKGIYERNALDDMRLAFELLLRGLLQNSKSLEKNIPIIGSELATRGVPAAFRNMLTSIINYYKSYQNDHIKHNDLVNRSEVEFVVELTSSIMKYLITILNRQKS